MAFSWTNYAELKGAVKNSITQLLLSHGLDAAPENHEAEVLKLDANRRSQVQVLEKIIQFLEEKKPSATEDIKKIEGEQRTILNAAAHWVYSEIKASYEVHPYIAYIASYLVPAPTNSTFYNLLITALALTKDAPTTNQVCLLYSSLAKFLEDNPSLIDENFKKTFKNLVQKIAELKTQMLEEIPFEKRVAEAATSIKTNRFGSPARPAAQVSGENNLSQGVSSDNSEEEFIIINADSAPALAVATAALSAEPASASAEATPLVSAEPVSTPAEATPLVSAEPASTFAEVTPLVSAEPASAPAEATPLVSAEPASAPAEATILVSAEPTPAPAEATALVSVEPASAPAELTTLVPDESASVRCITIMGCKVPAGIIGSTGSEKPAISSVATVSEPVTALAPAAATASVLSTMASRALARTLKPIDITKAVPLSAPPGTAPVIGPKRPYVAVVSGGGIYKRKKKGTNDTCQRAQQLNNRN